MPRFTEGRIQQLCTEALAVRTSEEVERVVHELRSALEEHIRLAKDSLENQAATLSTLSAKAGERRS
jgi:hypothetical protein